MDRISPKDLKLQPLAIPAGFKVAWNFFYNLLDQGVPIEMEESPAEASSYALYKEALFQVLHKDQKMVVDLGWYPEGDPKGEFCITIVKEKDKEWENPLVTFSSRSKDEIVRKLEQYMYDVSMGYIK